MKKIILILFLIFSGCSVKKILSKDLLYEKSLKHTKRCQIISSLETKAILDVVYLNPIYKDLKKNTLLIGVYNDFNNTINNVEFNLKINNQNISPSKKIPPFVEYKHFPFYNNWMEYYIVTLDQKPPYKIEYISKHWGECNLSVK